MDERRTVREGYDEVAQDYLDRRSAAGRARELAAAFAADAGARVLDAGCGAGVPATAEAVAACGEVVGMDLSRAQLGLLGEQVPAARPVQGDLTRLPFRDDAFGGLVSYYAVIHVPRERHAEVLAEFHRVLEPGAPLLVTMGTEAWEDENPDWLESGAEMFWSFYGRERNLELLAEAGFEVESEEAVGDSLGSEYLLVRARAQATSASR